MSVEGTYRMPSGDADRKLYNEIKSYLRRAPISVDWLINRQVNALRKINELDDVTDAYALGYWSEQYVVWYRPQWDYPEHAWTFREVDPPMRVLRTVAAINKAGGAPG